MKICTTCTVCVFTPQIGNPPDVHLSVNLDELSELNCAAPIVVDMFEHFRDVLTHLKWSHEWIHI